MIRFGVLCLAAGFASAQTPSGTHPRVLREEAKAFEASAAAPESASLARALGHAHFAVARYLEAAGAFSRADRIEPLDERSRFTLVNALIAAERRHWARPHLDQLIADHPRKAVYPYWLAGIYIHYQWLDEALAQLDVAVGLEPRMLTAHDRRGQTLQALGRFDEALEAYRRAEILNSGEPVRSPWPLAHRGALLIEMGRLKQAHKALRAAAAIDGSQSEIHYDLGVVQRELGDDPAAVEAFSEAARLGPADPKPHYALAEIYRRAGDQEKARESLQRFRSLR